MDTSMNQIDALIPESLHKSYSKQVSYASTDEDVDELNSHYSEIPERSIENYHEKIPANFLSTNINPQTRARILSTEYSQITVDSGVDINSEQKVYQPNTTLTIDEQSSEETTDQNDLFALSDDSLTESPKNNILSQIEQDTTFFSAKSELNTENNLYSGYELETITDDEDDDHRYSIKNKSNELIITSEPAPPPSAPAQPPPPPPPPPPPSFLPPQFEFKLPTFGEWIDRVFTTFLTETSESPPQLISSSRSSSIDSIHGSRSTINTSSSSKVTTVIENQNVQFPQTKNGDGDDDEHSLNDMSSSSLNCGDEKVDFDTYIINSNYEKINPSITNEQDEILFRNERSKSLLSPITSSIENDDQEVMNKERIMPNDKDDNISKQIEFQYSSNSHDSLLQSDQVNLNISTDDLTRTNQFLSSTFHSKDSALGLSDDNLNQFISREDEQLHLFQDKIVDNNGVIMIDTDTNIDDDITHKSTTIDEHDQSNARTISSSSSEQLIPKEKQTGMYYKAFGSSAAIHLAEQYGCEWVQDNSSSTKIDIPPEIDDNQLRIVHQYQTLGDNEDEFYFSPQQILPRSSSCPNLSLHSHETIRYHSYSLTTLDAYTHLNITHETLEQIWLSLLDVAFSDRDDYDLGEYKLRHIIGLSNSYSNMNQTLIEKSRSDNDIFSTNYKNNQKSIAKIKSKSFDMTSLIKHSTTIINHDSANIGLLQGADISEPFADRFLSTSIHSDLESIHSIEPEANPIENPSPPSPTIVKEPLDYVFNFSSQLTTDEFDFESDDKPSSISIEFDPDDIPLPIVQVHDTYTELSLFRPHSLSTIPSSRASQYASSVDSDDFFEHEHQLHKVNSEENFAYHLSDDDHGVIGSEFSSPQSRPLSSIQSRPLSPELNQIKSRKISEEHSIFDMDNDEYLKNLTTIIPIESIEDKDNYLIDQIEPILLNTQISQANFIEKIDEQINHTIIQEDYITNEPSSQSSVDPTELTHRLEQLDLSIKKEEIIKTVPKLPVPYQTQRISKVSDLEIVKQGKGFKIGYIDRQGTDQRVILTKRIEASPDIMERDPHIQIPYKGRRILNQEFSSVLYTNGYNTFQEDEQFQHSADDIEVPCIGTDPKHFDESDMVSLDIDGPSTMLNSICEAIVITQGTFYTKPTTSDQTIENCETMKKDKIEIVDSWHDRTIITGNSTPWRSPFKPPKTTKPIKSTRDIALSPILFLSDKIDQCSPVTVDRACQYSPPIQHDQGLQCYFESFTAYELPGYLKSQNSNSPIRSIMTLERSSDSGILVDDNHHRRKSNLALQVDIKSSSSDSEDLSELTTRELNLYENPLTTEIDHEIIQLRRERSHVLDLLSLNWNRSNIWVDLTEAKLNYIIGETDALLHSLSFDSSSIDNETIKLKMHQYEEDMAELTRQHLVVYRERLEDSKKQLDLKIDELELKKSSLESHLSTFEQIPRLLNTKRSRSYLSASAEDLTSEKSRKDTITSHPQLLDISFLTKKNSDQMIYRPVPRYATKTLANMEGLSQSQQAILDETDELIKDSQQFHTESASQFERARESLLSSETSIRLARENLAASRKPAYLPNDVTLAELFKYEQSLAKEAGKNKRHIYSTTES